MIFLFFITVSGQTYSEQWCQHENSDFDTIIQTSGIDSMLGTGYEQYQNLYEMCVPRLFPKKNFSYYNNSEKTLR